MLEFNKEKYNLLRQDNGYSHQDIVDILNNQGIEVKIDTVKNWTRKTKKTVPEYEKISALADLFGIPSLHLFVDGEKELEKNISIEMKLHPEKYMKYFEKEIRSDIYSDIIDSLEQMDDQKLSAIVTLIKG